MKMWYSPHLLPLKYVGRSRLGNHNAKPVATSQRMESSSKSWPRRDKVAWKYAELIPTIRNRNQTTYIPLLTNFPYWWNNWNSIGGKTRNRTLLICKQNIIISQLMFSKKCYCIHRIGIFRNRWWYDVILLTPIDRWTAVLQYSPQFHSAKRECSRKMAETGMSGYRNNHDKIQNSYLFLD